MIFRELLELNLVDAVDLHTEIIIFSFISGII